MVGVLNGLADRHEQFQPLPRRQFAVVAELGDGHALNQFHDEEGPAGVGGAGVQHLGDVGMVHEGQRLPFGLEAGQHLFGVHAGLDELDGDESADWFGLLGHEDGPHAALSDGFEEFVTSGQDGTDALNGKAVRVGGHVEAGGGVDGRGGGGAVHGTVGFVVGAQQRLHAAAQHRVTGAVAVEQGGAVGRRYGFEGGQENPLSKFRIDRHGKGLREGSYYHATFPAEVVEKNPKKCHSRSASPSQARA